MSARRVIAFPRRLRPRLEIRHDQDKYELTIIAEFGRRFVDSIPDIAEAFATAQAFRGIGAKVVMVGEYWGRDE
jgi:hypothetical protein